MKPTYTNSPKEKFFTRSNEEIHSLLKMFAIHNSIPTNGFSDEFIEKYPTVSWIEGELSNDTLNYAINNNAAELSLFDFMEKFRTVEPQETREEKAVRIAKGLADVLDRKPPLWYSDIEEAIKLTEEAKSL